MPRKRKLESVQVEERTVDAGSDTDLHSDAESEASDVVTAAPKKAKAEEGEKREQATDTAPEGMVAQAKSALLWLCSTAPKSIPDAPNPFSGTKNDTDAAAASSSKKKESCCK